MLFDENKKPTPLKGNTPDSYSSLILNGKEYTVHEKRNANGEVVYRAITDDKFLGIF